MLTDAIKGVTRIVVTEDNRILTDFNITDPIREAKARMLGRLDELGLSEYRLNDILFLINNSEKVIVIGGDEEIQDFELSFEKIIDRIQTPEQLKKLRLIINNQKFGYVTWSYHILQKALYPINFQHNREYWIYDDKNTDIKLLILAFALSWTKLLNTTSYRDKVDLFTTCSSDDMAVYSRVLNNMQLLDEQSQNRNIAQIYVGSNISSKYGGIHVSLDGSIDDISNALINLQFESNFKILPVILKRTYMTHRFELLLYIKHSNPNPIIIDTFDKFGIKLLSNI